MKNIKILEISRNCSFFFNLLLEALRLSYLNGHSATDLAAATSVVQSPHECPQELYTARKQFTEVGQNDKKHRDAENGVYNRDGPSCVCTWRNVSISCNDNRSIYQL